MLKSSLPALTQTAIVLQIVSSEKEILKIYEILSENFFEEDISLSCFESSPLEWGLDICLNTEKNEQNIINFLQENCGITDINRTIAYEKDWVKNSLDLLPAIRIGRFFVHGSHSKKNQQPNDFPIHIEASLAFGTGHHGTTRGCLSLFNHWHKTVYANTEIKQNKIHILDIGTGTGILAIAAKKTLNDKAVIIATDNDPIAIKVAHHNSKINNAFSLSHFLYAKSPIHPQVSEKKPYTLIFANILAKPLISLAKEINSLTSENSHLILSGLLHKDVLPILHCYRNYGFIPQKKLYFDEWAALLLARKS